MTDDIRQALGLRIKLAQQRAGFKRASHAIAAIEEQFGQQRRASYYTHINGTRMPDDDDLRLYAELFHVTLGYLKHGEEAEPSDSDASGHSANGVNQLIRKPKSRPSHNQSVRLIKILSADQVREFFRGQRDLALMSGFNLPVPGFLPAGPRSFAYQIPVDDVSMVAAAGPSYAPGASVVIDPDRPIAPGDRVYADIEGFPAPVIRRYVAARPYADGVKFSLQAFNPAFAEIKVDSDEMLRVLARVIWIGQEQ